jgi:hypothetical protein
LPASKRRWVADLQVIAVASSAEFDHGTVSRSNESRGLASVSQHAQETTRHHPVFSEQCCSKRERTCIDDISV